MTHNVAHKLSLPKSARFCRMTSHCQSYNYKKSENYFLSFKILKNNCFELGDHKTWIYAHIGITDFRSGTEYKQTLFSSFTKGLQELCDWLAKYNCIDVCMESTSKYWIPVFNVLEKNNFWVTLSHPKYTKPQKGKSTRFSRAGSYFKPVLVQIANALIKSKKHPKFAYNEDMSSKKISLQLPD